MKRIEVVAAVICHEGLYLATQRGYGEYKDYWEFPGGKVEPGESREEALRREIREELGCELRTLWPYDTVEHDYPDFHLTMDCFVCTLPEGADPAPRAGVHSELRWLARDELLDVEWLPADVSLMRTLAFYWDEAFADQLL